jgi:hypothetical protein
MKRGARWEEIVNRWPFRKGVDHSGASGLHLHYIWPRGKPGGPTQASRSIKLARARWSGPSPELASEGPLGGANELSQHELVQPTRGPYHPLSLV